MATHEAIRIRELIPPAHTEVSAPLQAACPEDTTPLLVGENVELDLHVRITQAVAGRAGIAVVIGAGAPSGRAAQDTEHLVRGSVPPGMPAAETGQPLPATDNDALLEHLYGAAGGTSRP